MPTCPKCKKQELEPGEKLCPCCQNERSNIAAKVCEGLIFVAGVIYYIIFKKRN